MGIAALAFTSCAKDTVKEINKGRAIDFRVAAQTRAAETTTANLAKFYATAFDENGADYFKNVPFTRLSTYYTSDPLYYWPGSGYLNIYAYAPSASELKATVAGTEIKEYSPADKIADQVDLITAKKLQCTESTGAEGVDLMFEHQLSQIMIQARNGNLGYVYNIMGVRIAQPVSKGNFDLEDGEWTLDTDVKKTHSETYTGDPITLNEYAQSLMIEGNGNAMLLPQQLYAWDHTDNENAAKGAYLSVLAQVTTSDGSRVYPTAEGLDYAWLAVPVATKWEAGYKYVYTLDFTDGAGYPDPDGGDNSNGAVLGGPIKFTMEVNPWVEKATEEAKKNLLIGSWTAIRLEENIYCANGDVERNVYDKDTETSIYDYLYDMYIYFDIINESEFVVFGGTENAQTFNYHIEDNHLYIEPYLDQATGEYIADLFIRDLTEEMLTVCEAITLENGNYRINVCYYARQENQ